MTAAPPPPPAPPLARNGGKAHTFAILPGSPGPYVDETAMKNIRNIGIMHSREFQEGALRIEFYDEATMRTASLLLKENAYTIYDK